MSIISTKAILRHFTAKMIPNSHGVAALLRGFWRNLQAKRAKMDLGKLFLQSLGQFLMQRLLISFLFLLLLGQKGQADIMKISNLKPLLQAIQQSPQDTLVVFDVDDVLIQANDQILRGCHKKELDKIIAKLMQHYSVSHIQELTSIVLLQHQNTIIDHKIFDIFNLLKKKNIPFIALTATATGKIGSVESFEDWRIGQLHSLGFDFSHSFPDIMPFLFTDLVLNDGSNYYPSYKAGILFSSTIPKGDVLKAFLSHTKISFEHIIFIDDLLGNLESVRAFCQATGLSYQGFHYQPSSSLLPLDHQRVQRQVDTLLKEGKWLSDRQATVP